MNTKIKLVHKDTLSCEPIVRRMSDGSLLIVGQCGDTYEPAPLNRVYFFHSTDDGETWSKPTKIIPEDGNAVYCTEVAVIGDRILAFLTLHQGRFFDWRSLVVESTDCGHNWKKLGAFEHCETFTFVRGMIKLSNGDLLLPYHHYEISEAENDKHREFYQKRYMPNGRLFAISDVPFDSLAIDNGVVVSSDGGKTFKKFPAPAFPIYGETGVGWCWTEPTVVELEAGHLVMLIRVTKDVLWRSDSFDFGKTWSDFSKTDIPNPSCKTKLIKIEEGKIALIHAANSKKRHPLCLWISNDNMKTWQVKQVITDFPLTYDYPDGFYENGKLYLSIECSRRDILFIKIEL